MVNLTLICFLVKTQLHTDKIGICCLTLRTFIAFFPPTQRQLWRHRPTRRTTHFYSKSLYFRNILLNDNLSQN